MNLHDRLAPRLYSLLHCPETFWDLILTPAERTTARRDAARLQDRLPFLAVYDELASRFQRKLHSDYTSYTSSVSPESIAISLELATFLAAVCEFTRPMNSSMILGLLPAAGMTLGWGMSVGIGISEREGLTSHPSVAASRL